MYKIVIDSCGDLSEEIKSVKDIVSIPLEIDLGDYHLVDDEHFDQADFLKRVKESPVAPKSSCPSPERYMNSFEGEEEHVYVVTLSGKLSGSYNSAELGKNLYYEEHEYTTKKIHVFNSKSASCGETLIGLKIRELELTGMDFEQIVKTVEDFITEMTTYFVLETLETLRKNGRLSNLKAFVASALNIKPVMSANKEGEITQLGQTRGMGKALKKMVDFMVEATKDVEQKTLAIAHCNCLERALTLKADIEKIAAFREIIIVETAGISSMYANDGGIIMTV